MGLGAFQTLFPAFSILCFAHSLKMKYMLILSTLPGYLDDVMTNTGTCADIRVISNHASTSPQRFGKLQTCGTQLEPKRDGDICSGLAPAFHGGEPGPEGRRAQLPSFSVQLKH